MKRPDDGTERSGFAIEARSVSKRFGRRLALDNVTLRVPRGAVYGLLGHNGAGKSTLLGVLLGQIFPDSGDLRIDGANVFTERDRALRRLGALYETPAFYDYLSGRRNLEILYTYSAKPDPKQIAWVAELVGLGSELDRPVRSYSHGMRQRLALAQALLPEPEILVLDEPADGLDPEALVEFRQLIVRLNRERGITILLSSHLLNEVRAVCTHVAVLRRGRMVFDGELATLLTDRQRVRLTLVPREPAMAALVRAGWVSRWEGGDVAQLAPSVELPAVIRWCVGQGFEVLAAAPVELSLEDLYLKWMGD